MLREDKEGALAGAAEEEALCAVIEGVTGGTDGEEEAVGGDEKPVGTSLAL